MNGASLILYGEDGPVFERWCPKCRRFLKFPKTMHWREDFTGHCTFDSIACPKCGLVKPEHIGWAGDYR